MTFDRGFVICLQQTCVDKNIFPYFVPVVIENTNIVISLLRLTKVGEETNRWSSPPHQRVDASKMEMTHIQMQLSKPQNRWDLRAEANFPSKVSASVLRWCPRYDSLTASGVHGWLVMKPTEICVDKRDTRNSRPDWEVTFLCYAWLWSVHWRLCSACLCRVQIPVPLQQLQPGTQAASRNQPALQACHQNASHSTQMQWKFRNKTKNYTQISSDAVQTLYDIIRPQRGE